MPNKLDEFFINSLDKDDNYEFWDVDYNKEPNKHTMLVHKVYNYGDVIPLFNKGVEFLGCHKYNKKYLFTCWYARAK